MIYNARGKLQLTLKDIVKKLPCLGIVDPNAFMIVEMDALEIGYGGMLKQELPNSHKE